VVERNENKVKLLSSLSCTGAKKSLLLKLNQKAKVIASRNHEAQEGIMFVSERESYIVKVVNRVMM